MTREGITADWPVTALAYLGDSVYETEVRERLDCSGMSSSASLNSAALKYVTAPAQSKASEIILPLLSAEEENLYKRGRNSTHIKNAPRGATLNEYRRASGLETLFGFLWLTGRKDRVGELLAAAFPELYGK
ncbi:MAG: ribonuclease III [Clostridia bacterium]|nr:ribonuclease III [Clostridia bacterium]